MKIISTRRQLAVRFAALILGVALLPLGVLTARAGDPVLNPYRRLAMRDPEAARKTIRLYNIVSQLKFTPRRRIDDLMVREARSCIKALLSLDRDPGRRKTLHRLYRAVGELDGLTVKEAAVLLANIFPSREG